MKTVLHLEGILQQNSYFKLIELILVKIAAQSTKLPKFPRSNAATLQGFLWLCPCHVSHVTIFFLWTKWWILSVEGLLWTGRTPSSYLLWSTSKWGSNCLNRKKKLNHFQLLFCSYVLSSWIFCTIKHCPWKSVMGHKTLNWNSEFDLAVLK